MRNFVLGFFSALLLPAAALFLYLRSGGADVHADVPAPPWQQSLMNFAVHASVARAASTEHVPVAHTDDDLVAGGRLYANGCAGCHGALGREPRKHPTFLSPPAFAHFGTRYSEPEVIWIVKHGIRRTGMSAYAASFTDAQLWSLAGFMTHMRDLPVPVREQLKASGQ
jgi:mono/diheme cytochrome c family protein